MLNKHDIAMEERPARRHNKVGVVDSPTQRASPVQSPPPERRGVLPRDTRLVTSDKAILSKAKFLWNALRGNSTLSSFGLVRGNAPSFVGLPQTETSKELLEVHYEQQSKRALTRILRSKAPRVINADLLPPKTPVYYYIQGQKQAK